MRSRDRFLVFGAPEIGEEEYAELADCLRRRWLGTGPKVAQFERDFAAYKGAQHAIAVNSCTAALHLAMLASGVGPGDEVITTAMTFCATVNAIIHTGAKPVLADCEPDTGNIDPAAVEARITARTRALVVVHFAGRICRMDRLLEIAHRHGVIVIEDCAHAIETTWRGRPAGTMGSLGCFSFYATKNITTGEGGMIVTNDAELAATARRYGLHGLSKDAWQRYSDAGYRHYQVLSAGYKYNMMDLQAALGIHQLRRVEASWEVRRQLVAHYDTHLQDLPCDLPLPAEEESRHGLHLYPIRVQVERLGRPRDWVLDALTAENIGVGVHYLAIPEHPYYRDEYGWRTEDYPNARRYGRTTLSLPLSAGMEEEDVADVCTAVRKVLGT